MRQLCIMLKPASSLCNLRCKYCFYADIAEMREIASYGVMTAETREAVLNNIRSGLRDGDMITFAFQGGEPTMAGLDYFRDFAAQVDSWGNRIHVNYALQTNSTLLDENWCRFLAERRFLVGVSLDLEPDCHDRVRVDLAGRGTYKRVLQAIRMLEQFKVDYNVLCTLTNQIARHPSRVWKQITKMDLKYVQFTPCLDELGLPGGSIYALTPQRFASFYNQMFPLWDAAYRQGDYRSVKLFDDIVNLLAYGIPSACGIDGQCRPQMVVEADGSSYPCDFYCVDQYCLGNLAESSFAELLQSPAMTQFALRPHQRPSLCEECPFANFCGGGCKRMQREVCCSGSEKFCGYQSFLKNYMPRFQEIAREQRWKAK